MRGTAQAALTLARNMLNELGNQVVATPNEGAAAALPLIDLAAEIVKHGNLAADGEHVVYRSKLDLDVAETAIATLTPALVAARSAAQRSQASNKQ